MGKSIFQVIFMLVMEELSFMNLDLKRRYASLIQIQMKPTPLTPIKEVGKNTLEFKSQ